MVFSDIESDTRRLERRDLTARFGPGPKAPSEGPPAVATSQAIPLWTSLLGIGALIFFFEGLLLLG